MRGTPASEVEQNQRERLFAAMVACLDAKGYAATTVADLVEVSGVSSRSFYDLFGDKARCLRESIEAMLEKAAPGFEEGAEEELEAALRQRYRAFVATISEQPAAAKVCLSEAFVAGSVAREPIEKAIERVEDELTKSYRRSAEHGAMPTQLVAARIGGVLEVARARLREGREGSLASDEQDIVALMIADRPAPQALRLGVRRKKTGPESLAAPGHAERAIRAFAVLVADKGYHETTVDEVVKRASMSARTFYANFAGKEDLMWAAIDTACAQAVAAVVPAFSRNVSWPDGVRAGYGALFDFLASRPALAQLVTVEVYAAGEEMLKRRSEALAPLGALLAVNTAEWEQMPPVIYQVLGGGIVHLLYEMVRKSGPDSLPGLAPICTYLTLSPFIGAQAACEAANGAGTRSETRGRWSFGETTGAIPFRAPMRPTLIKALSFLDDPATPKEIASEVGEGVAVVADYLQELAKAGAIRRVGEKEGEPVYSSVLGHDKLKTISSQRLAAMSPEEVDEFSRAIWEIIARDTERALEGGSFKNRVDWFLTRTPMRLDETGWRELTDLHSRAMHESFEIQARSRERLKESGGPAIEARSMQAAFEMPAGEEEAAERSETPEAEEGS